MGDVGWYASEYVFFIFLLCMLIVNMDSRQAETKHAFVRIHTAHPA